MPHRDSLDKIIRSYIHAVAAEPFWYGEELLVPKRLYVSTLLERGYTCPPKCGGCCPRFSLDYLPDDDRPSGTHKRFVVVNGRPRQIASDMQRDHPEHFCKYLDPDEGRCRVYERRPFSCDFELIRVCSYADRFWMGQKLFGRGWAMKRVDGGRGARCEMTASDAKTRTEVVRKLRRLEQWARHFDIATVIDEVVQWIDAGPWSTPLIIDPTCKRRARLPVHHR